MVWIALTNGWHNNYINTCCDLTPPDYIGSEGETTTTSCLSEARNVINWFWHKYREDFWGWRVMHGYATCCDTYTNRPDYQGQEEGELAQTICISEQNNTIYWVWHDGEQPRNPNLPGDPCPTSSRCGTCFIFTDPFDCGTLGEWWDVIDGSFEVVEDDDDRLHKANKADYTLWWNWTGGTYPTGQWEIDEDTPTTNCNCDGLYEPPALGVQPINGKAWTTCKQFNYYYVWTQGHWDRTDDTEETACCGSQYTNTTHTPPEQPDTDGEYDGELRSVECVPTSPYNYNRVQWKVVGGAWRLIRSLCRCCSKPTTPTVNGEEGQTLDVPCLSEENNKVWWKWTEPKFVAKKIWQANYPAPNDNEPMFCVDADELPEHTQYQTWTYGMVKPNEYANTSKWKWDKEKFAWILQESCCLTKEKSSFYGVNFSVKYWLPCLPHYPTAEDCEESNVEDDDSKRANGIIIYTNCPKTGHIKMAEDSKMLVSYGKDKLTNFVVQVIVDNWHNEDEYKIFFNGGTDWVSWKLGSVNISGNDEEEVRTPGLFSIHANGDVISLPWAAYEDLIGGYTPDEPIQLLVHIHPSEDGEQMVVQAGSLSAYCDVTDPRVGFGCGQIHEDTIIDDFYVVEGNPYGWWYSGDNAECNLEDTHDGLQDYVFWGTQKTTTPYSCYTGYKSCSGCVDGIAPSKITVSMTGWEADPGESDPTGTICEFPEGQCDEDAMNDTFEFVRTGPCEYECTGDCSMGHYTMELYLGGYDNTDPVTVSIAVYIYADEGLGNGFAQISGTVMSGDTNCISDIVDKTVDIPAHSRLWWDYGTEGFGINCKHKAPGGAIKCPNGTLTIDSVEYADTGDGGE